MDNFGDLYTMAFKNLSSLFLPIVLGMFATTLLFDEHKNDTLKELLAGVKVAQYLIDHYDKSNCFEQYCNKLIAVFHKNYPEKNDGNIVEAMKVRKRVAETIENHLCFIFSTVENVDKQKIAVELCKSALAYFMANDEEKALLERMFSVIALKVGKLDHLRLQKYSKTMIGVDLSLQIEKWIVENSLTQRNYSNEQMVNMLISFFLKTHKIKKGTDSFVDICQMWLNGCSFDEINKRTSLPIADIEDICSKSVSYELSFFVGNIIDVIELSDEDIANPLPNLLLLQRRIKCGVKSETAVSVCEKVFNERFLANLMAEKMRHDAITTDKIVSVVKSYKDDILGFFIELSNILF